MREILGARADADSLYQSLRHRAELWIHACYKSCASRSYEFSPGLSYLKRYAVPYRHLKSSRSRYRNFSVLTVHMSLTFIKRREYISVRPKAVYAHRHACYVNYRVYGSYLMKMNLMLWKSVDLALCFSYYVKYLQRQLLSALCDSCSVYYICYFL